MEPPPPLEPLPDFRAAVRRALEAPLGFPPVARLVGRGSRVTVAFDDPCLPLPPLLFDPRRVMFEEVVHALLQAGVRPADMTLICANGLHRQWSQMGAAPAGRPAPDRPLRRAGDLLRRRGPGRQRPPGRTSSGLVVEVSRVVADADLVVYVGVPWTEMNGGHKSLACGLATYRASTSTMGRTCRRTAR